MPSIQPAENVLYEGKTTAQKWLSLDWVGGIISLAMITSLLLPLQWGGVLYPWNDRRVIALFCVVSFPLHLGTMILIPAQFAVLFIAFLGWEFYKKERAMLPLFLFKRRTQVGSGIAMFLMMVSFLVSLACKTDFPS